MMRRYVSLPLLLLLGAALGHAAASAQDASSRFATGGPRFLRSTPSSTEPLDVRRTPVLRQRVSLDFADVRLDDALAEITRQSGLRFMYSNDVVPLDRRVTVRMENVTLAAALTELLLDAEVDMVLSQSARTIVVRRTPNLVQAEPGTVVGRVASIETGDPVVNAQITVDERGRAVTTEDGRYSIEGVEPGRRTIGVQSMGFTAVTREVDVGDGATVTVNFALEVSATQLDAVVVTATGAQRRVELGHVMGNIRADSVVRGAPVTDLSDLIGARVAGVQLIQNDGFSGGAPRIRIRGLGSISRNRDPLVYVDGVRVESSTGTITLPLAGWIGSYGLSPGRFNDVNPNDIESIEVVKGPSAATLYGTDAANGVILIRTKRGKPGDSRWNLYVEGGLLSPGVSLDRIDGYYGWGRETATGQQQRCMIVQMAAGACVQDSVTAFNPLTHPATTPIGTGTRFQVGSQVSGGAPSLTYFLSADYEEETGYLQMPALEVERIKEERGGVGIPDWQVRPNAAKGLSARGSLQAQLGENAEVRFSSGLVLRRTRIPGPDAFIRAYYGPGYRDANDGWWGARPGEIFAVKSSEGTSRYTGSLNATLRPLPWLAARATVGTDMSDIYYQGLQRRDEGPLGATRTGQRLHSRTRTAHHTVDLGASARLQIASRVGSRTSVGLQYSRRDQLVSVANASDLPPGSETMTGAAVVSSDEGRSGSVVAGAFLEQMLALNDRLFITGALRADGASSFGRNFRTAFYSKASVSWSVSDEPFFPEIPGLDDLRLRLAYGESGVQPGSTDALALISRFTTEVDGHAASGAAFGTNLGNPNLKPERQREIEGGIDLELLSRRVSVEATYYNKLSTDALMTEPLAASLGLLERWVNVGSVRNWGYEASVGISILQRTNLSWEANLSGSINHNRLAMLGVPGVTALGTLGQRHVEGYALFGMWDRPILGYADANENGIIEPGEVQVGDTLEYLGPGQPPRQLTLSTALSLLGGRLRLSSQFDYRGGHMAGNALSAQCAAFSSCRAVNDPGAPLSDQARAVARISHSTSAGYLEDASFVRWREIAATYQLPARLARHVGASDISVTVSGRNLRLWTNYTGFDPELQQNPGYLFIEGVGGVTAPQTRYWLVRADVGF